MKKSLNIFIVILFFIVINFSNSYSGPRNVFLEYCTGTWCGYCPCGHDAFVSIKAVYPQTIGIAYHGGSNDPWQNFNGFQVRTLLGFNAYPTAIIDRGNTPSNPYVTYDQWFGRVQNRYSSSPNSNVDLMITSKTYDAFSRELNLTFNTTALDNLNGQYKLSVAIVEDNLIYQQNYYSTCGTPGYVQDYVHTDVARSMVNGPTGENLNTGNVWNLNEVISKSISTVLDQAWTPGNCKIIAFVYRDSSILAYANVEQAIEENITQTGILGNPNASLD